MDILKTIKDGEENNHGITTITGDNATLCGLMFDDLDVIENVGVVGIEKGNITCCNCKNILKEYKRVVNYYK